MSPSNRPQRVALSAFLATALVACAELPPPQAPHNSKPIQSYASQASFAASPADWPEAQWWRRYQDAQLTGLIEEALAGSPDLAQARARVLAAGAAATVAGAAQLPSLQAQANLTEVKQSYNYGIPPAFVPHGYLDAATTQLSAQYELDLWGKNRAIAAAALSEEEAAKLDSAMVEITLSSAVADAYADFARLHAERDVAEEALKIRRATFDLAKRRLESGLDTRAEYKQAEAGVPAAEANLLAIEESIALTRNRLAALLGAGPDRGLAIGRPEQAHLPAFGLPANLSLDLLGRRADIQAARARASAAAKRIDVAEAAFYPNVNIVGFLGAQALGIEFLTKSGSDIGGIGPAITLPIFTGHQLQGRYRAAEADYANAVASYDASVTKALRDVADVAVSGKALGAELAATRKAVADSGEAYQLSKRRYEGGLANYQSVLIAEDALLANQRALADLEARAFSLDIALTRALGGGFKS